MATYSSVIEVIKGFIPWGVKETEMNESLGRALKKSGFSNTVNARGVDIVGSDYIIEGKKDLIERNHVLPKLEYQIRRYVDEYGFMKDTYIAIYGNAKMSLVDELKQYCYSSCDFLVPIIVVKGKVIKE
jgi:hypothetical protein